MPASEPSGAAASARHWWDTVRVWTVQVLDLVLAGITLAISLTFLRGVDLQGFADDDLEDPESRGNTLFLTLPVWLALATAFIAVRLIRMHRSRRAQRPGRLPLPGRLQGYLMIVATVLAVFNGARFVILGSSDTAKRAAEAGGYGEWFAALEYYAIPMVVLAWVVLQLSYAERYARMWVAGRRADHQVLVFPGTETPTLADFFYFAVTFGVAFATSDVQIRSTHVRSVASFHALLSFLFNAVIVASMVGLLTK